MPYPTSSSSGPLPDFKHRWIGVAAASAAFVLLAIWTWRKCGDLLQDFGHQLYVPWQLSEGSTLYTDIFWLYGPLSQYFHAALFELLSPSLTTILVSNLLIAACVCVSLYLLTLRLANHLTAATTVIVVASLLLFSHYLSEGNFSFVFPYAHEATHGTCLLLALILFLTKCGETPRRSAAFASGVCLGLSLLTKIEPASAALMVTFMFFALCREARSSRILFTLALGAMLPLGVGWAALLRALPPELAASALFGAFSPLAKSATDLLSTQFHREVLGLENPALHLHTTLVMSGTAAVAILALAIVDTILARMRLVRLFSAVFGFLAFVLLFLLPQALPWFDLPRGIAAVLLVGMLIRLLARLRSSHAGERAWLPEVLLFCAALVLASRLGLRIRFYHYGFFLSLPLLALLSISVLHQIPAALRRLNGNGETFRFVSFAFLAALVATHLRFSDFYLSQRTVPTGSGGDLFYTYSAEFSPTAELERSVLSYLRQWAPGERGVSVIPSGSAINYLLRTPSPLPYAWVGIDVLRLAGEGVVLERLRQSEPLFIVLVGRKGADFSFGLPGDREDVGQEIYSWIQANYEEIRLLAHPQSEMELRVLKLLQPQSALE